MIKGALSLLAGMRLMLVNRGLRSVLWRMVGLLFLLMLALMGGVFWFVDYLNALWLPDGDAWYWLLLSWLVGLLSFIVAMLTGAVSFAALASASVAPWLDELGVRTAAVHGEVLQESGASWQAQVMHSLMNSLRPLFGLLLWGVVALAFIWLPPVATAIWVYAGIHFLNFELMDTHASRLGWKFAERKAELKTRRFYWLGFGATAMALMIVPFVNLLVLPAAVVALFSQAKSAETPA